MSVVNDLRECTEILEALRQEVGDDASKLGSGSASPVVAGALLAQAVIWYVRATKTSSDHRSFVPIAKRMPADLAVFHQRMVDLRDGALAHFGPGEDGDRPRWAKELASLRVDGDQATLTFLYTRSKMQTDLPQQLQALLDYAVPRAWEIANERGDILLGETKRLYDSDEAFAEKLRTLNLDLWSVFDGDPVAVQQAIDCRSTAETFVPPSYWRKNFNSD